MKKVIFIPVIFILITACQKAKPNVFTEVESKMVFDSVNLMLHDYFKAIEKNGLESEFEYLDSSKQFFWVPPGYDEPLSYTKVEKAIKTNASKYTLVKSEWEIVSILPLSEQYATYNGVIKSMMIDKLNDTTFVRLIETGVVKKTETGWKLFNGQTSMIE